MLVMVLMGIFASFALPPAIRSQQAQRLNMAVAQVQADLARARSEAINRNATVALTRNSTSTYTITGLATRTLPDGILFDPRSSAGVTFTTYGTVTATSDQTFSLRVHTRTGAVIVNAAGFARLQ
jgi:type II secretory pathway pseudopilin PulG